MLSHTHIAICRLDNIGDAILTFPMISYVKNKFPHTKITFICRDYVKPVAVFCQSIDAIITESELNQDTVNLLKQQTIDTIILFPQTPQLLAKAAKSADIPLRIGTRHKLAHWFYCNRLIRFKRKKSYLHETQLIFQLLQPLNFKITPTLVEISQLYQLKKPAPFNNFFLEPNFFHLILHPKSNGHGREWPLPHYVELAKQLTAYPIKIWITGSTQEGEHIQQMAPELYNMHNVSVIAGQLDLTELVEFINQADGLIASGTGPLHLSAALGKCTLGLFPPVAPINPTRWAAIGTHAQNLCQPACAQSSCKQQPTCPCMAAITPTQVKNIVLNWLNPMFSDNVSNQYLTSP